jgi:hypothetical protein
MLPSEIMDISPTNPQNGMSGYYLTPLIGAYCAHVPGQLIGEILQPRDDRVADFIRRGEEDQYLTIWRDEDHLRLGLVGQEVVGFTQKQGTGSGGSLLVKEDKDITPTSITAVIRRKRAQGME